MHLNILNALKTFDNKCTVVWLHSVNISMMSKPIYKLASDWLVKNWLIGPPLNIGAPVYLRMDPLICSWAYTLNYGCTYIFTGGPANIRVHP